MRIISSMKYEWYNQYRWKWGIWFGMHNITINFIQSRWGNLTPPHVSFNTIEDNMWRMSWQHVRERKFILFRSKQFMRYKNYVLYTLKPHNNQLFYAMKMGKPKDAINYRRIIYWRQWQYVLGTICTYYFDHHNNIEIHDIQNNSVYCKR